MNAMADNVIRVKVDYADTLCIVLLVNPFVPYWKNPAGQSFHVKLQNFVHIMFKIY